MSRVVSLSLVCVCLLASVAFADRPSDTTKLRTSEDVLRMFLKSDFDLTVTVRQVQTEDYKRWGKENGFPVSDPSFYDQARLARLGDYHFIEVKTYDKDGKLVALFRSVWDKTTYRQYQEIPSSKTILGLIQKVSPDFDLIGPIKMDFQAVTRHVVYDNLDDVNAVWIDPATGDVLEVWRGAATEVPMKATYTGYQVRDGRRVAQRLAFEMRTPSYGTLAKTVTTDLVAFKAKPDITLFVDPIPKGTPVWNSITDTNYIQSEE